MKEGALRPFGGTGAPEHAAARCVLTFQFKMWLWFGSSVRSLSRLETTQYQAACWCGGTPPNFLHIDLLKQKALIEYSSGVTLQFEEGDLRWMLIAGEKRLRSVSESLLDTQTLSLHYLPHPHPHFVWPYLL